MRTIACPACDLKDAYLVLEQEAGDLGTVCLVSCRGCGMAYLDPQPDPAEIALFYAGDYYGGGDAKFKPWVEMFRGLLARTRAGRLARGLPAHSRVLDVGCGDGRLLAAFAALGHEGAGTERRDQHPRPGLAAGGVQIRSGDLTEVHFPDEQFDLCVYWHVLEHLHDPQASLSQARRVLKPGARLVAAVPNFESFQARWAGEDWFHLDLPRHLFHFTPRSLAALMARAGFRVDRIGHYSVEQNPFGALQSALNRWAGSEDDRNLLYEILKGTRHGVPFGRRMAQGAAFVVGMPIAIGLATLESMLGRGGTIEAWATREPEA